MEQGSGVSAGERDPNSLRDKRDCGRRVRCFDYDLRLSSYCVKCSIDALPEVVLRKIRDKWLLVQISRCDRFLFCKRVPGRENAKCVPIDKTLADNTTGVDQISSETHVEFAGSNEITHIA